MKLLSIICSGICALCCLVGCAVATVFLLVSLF